MNQELTLQQVKDFGDQLRAEILDRIQAFEKNTGQPPILTITTTEAPTRCGKMVSYKIDVGINVTA